MSDESVRTALRAAINDDPLVGRRVERAGGSYQFPGVVIGLAVTSTRQRRRPSAGVSTISCGASGLTWRVLLAGARRALRRARSPFRGGGDRNPQRRGFPRFSGCCGERCGQIITATRNALWFCGICPVAATVAVYRCGSATLVTAYSEVLDEALWQRDAKLVADVILAHELRTFTPRDVASHSRPFRALDERQAETVFRHLELLGWIQEQEPPGQRTRGRPARARYVTNPRVFDTFTERQSRERRRREALTTAWRAAQRGAA